VKFGLYFSYVSFTHTNEAGKFQVFGALLEYIASFSFLLQNFQNDQNDKKKGATEVPSWAD